MFFVYRRKIILKITALLRTNPEALQALRGFSIPQAGKEIDISVDNFTSILILIKGVLQMTSKLQAWRFIAILIAVVLSFAVWRAPELITAIRWW